MNWHTIEYKGIRLVVEFYTDDGEIHIEKIKLEYSNVDLADFISQFGEEHINEIESLVWKEMEDSYDGQ